jgi:hypothetical protein
VKSGVTGRPNDCAGISSGPVELPSTGPVSVASRTERPDAGGVTLLDRDSQKNRRDGLTPG